MLPTNTSIPNQTDRTLMQNIELLGQSQSQMYSLLASTKNSSPSPSSKRVHRKKKSKLDETTPVTINPQIARTSLGVSFAASTPDSVARHINNLSCRLYVDQHSYDTNNNIYHHQMPASSISRNPYIMSRTPQVFSMTNESMSNTDGDFGPHNTGKLPFLELNRSLGRYAHEKTRSDASMPKNDAVNLNFSHASGADTSPFDHMPMLPSAPASFDLLVKPKQSKRKNDRSVRDGKSETLSVVERSQRTPLLAANQQQPAPSTSSYPEQLHQYMGSNSLPAVIPTSIYPAGSRVEDYTYSRELPSSSNFAPLTPPASIISIQSPPVNGNYESSAMSVQQYLLPPLAGQPSDGNPPSRAEFSFPPKQANSSYGNRHPYDLHRVLATSRQQYYMLPSNTMSTSLIPIGYASILPNTVPSMSVAVGGKKEQIPSEKSERRTALFPHSMPDACPSEQSINSAESATETASSKRKAKSQTPTTADIRTKKQLKHLSRRNKLAVLKFMMRKRKHQQQQQQPLEEDPLCEIQLPENEAETKESSPLATSDAALANEMETSLTDIITPSLKVSFDSTQKIEFISLCYHRRRQTEVTSQQASKTKDNKLDLLLEAVEYIEAWQSTPTVPVESNK